MAKTLQDREEWFVVDQKGRVLAGPMSSMAGRAFAEQTSSGEKGRYCELRARRTLVTERLVERFEA